MRIDAEKSVFDIQPMAQRVRTTIEQQWLIGLDMLLTIYLRAGQLALTPVIMTANE